eukprot:symbB.v1.2.025106.t1/scaffold2387.1/size80445/1
MSTVGRMDGAFFVSRTELLSWLNGSFQLSLDKVEQCANGAVYCQIIDACHPGAVNMKKINWAARDEHQSIPNYKVLQQAFSKVGIERHVEVDKLIRGKYQDNLEMLQWIKIYFDRNFQGAIRSRVTPLNPNKLCLFEILQLADFIEATEGQQLPLKSFRGSNGWSESESESTEESCDSAIEWEEDVFYYIITGSVLLTPTPESGIKEVILDSGYFVDGPALMTALGQSSVVLAMQPLPPTAVVSEKTLLLRWTGRAVRQIITSSGFALECLRIVVASATLDSFYKNAVKEESLPTFQAVEAKRKELARAPLPKDAAMLQRSFFQQFCLSHMTLRDLWEPSPRQRVINAIRTGSRQMVFRHHLHETFESMTRMHRAASIPLEGLPENRTTDLARQEYSATARRLTENLPDWARPGTGAPAPRRPVVEAKAKSGGLGLVPGAARGRLLDGYNSRGPSTNAFEMLNGERRRRRRGVREEPRRSRSPVTEVGRLSRKDSLPRESVPVLELGKTSGVTSAGAWAARLEMANLLEARCDPTTLIKMTREGTEGDHPLDMSGKLQLNQQASLKVERVSEISERSKLSLDLGESDEASSMGRGGASSRASMRSATEKRPEWAHPVVEKSTAPEKTYFSSIPQGLSFAKPAFPKGTRPEEKSKSSSQQDGRVEDEE